MAETVPSGSSGCAVRIRGIRDRRVSVKRPRHGSGGAWQEPSSQPLAVRLTFFTLRGTRMLRAEPRQGRRKRHTEPVSGLLAALLPPVFRETILFQYTAYRMHVAAGPRRQENGRDNGGRHLFRPEKAVPTLSPSQRGLLQRGENGARMRGYWGGAYGQELRR
jgi:hypothetical protein